MYTQLMAPSCNKIPFSNKKELNISTCNNLNEAI